jgi:signal transduction histidine kinase
VLVTALAVVLSPETPLLAALRGSAFDAYQRLAPRPRLSAPVVIVEIDDASLAEYGQWPWPRIVLGRLLEAIAVGRPAAIGVDILMPEADRLSPDRVAALVAGVDVDLAARLARLPGNDAVLGAIVARHRVVLGMAGIDTGESGGADLRQRTVTRVVGGDALRHVHVFGAALRDINEIDAGAAGRGLVNTEPGTGSVRRLPVVAAIRDALFASLGVEMLRVAAGAPSFTVRVGRDSINAVEVGDLSVPTQPDGTVFIHYGQPDSSHYVSAADVLSGRVDVARFDRRLVLVGVTAAGLGDVHTTPLAARMPGVEIHAQWLESVFDGRTLLRPSWASLAEAGVLGAGGVLLVIALPALPAWSAALVVPLVLTAVAATGFVMYVRAGLLLDGALPVLGLAITAATVILAMLAQSQWQRRVLRQQRKQAEKQVRQLNEDLRRHADALEQRVQARTAQLAERNKELKDFAYTVSHDLKAPLRGIAGYANELVRKHRGGLSKRAQFCVTQILSAATNLDRLIEDLLHYSRLDAETPSVTDVNLRDVVDAVLRDRQLVITEQQVEVTVDVPFATFRAWERGLVQIVTNLIDNAIKYSRKASPARVRVAAAILDEEWRLTVSDNGIGFDMMYHDRIFGLFNRLVRMEDYEGTGAGLAIVKKVVDKQGGCIWAESAPGEGATFFVVIPMPRDPE